ncbi:hypothetical protein PDL71_08000 [Lacibacter sp. MH-610]|uniref:hypothetical protein n=1 Tax=Lacibacter sp. MH-610 TaxID=3020883 RepID=UPI00389244E2
MELITYKTEIRNESAAGKVALLLNQLIGSSNWQLDLESADGLLTVFSPGALNEPEIRATIQQAGFEAKSIERIYSIY